MKKTEKGKIQITLRKSIPKQESLEGLERHNIYTPHNERIFQLENGYYLLYYHRPEPWRMFYIYLKYIIPIVTLMYFIKKNPWYLTYPAMLPAMVVFLVGTIISLIKYSKVTNMMIHQVQMDPTGTELMFIY